MNRMIVASLLLAAAATSSPAGVRFTANMSGTNANGKAQEGAFGNQMTVQAEGTAFKLVFNDAKKKQSGYMLSRDGGQTVYMVNPEEKTYLKWDFSSMAGLAGGVMKVMNMKISDVKSEALASEAGPRILGYATQHVKYRTTYNTETSFLGRKSVTVTAMDHEYWVAEALSRDLMAAMYKMTPKTGNEELDKLAEAQRTKIKGFPLKSVTTSTSTDSKGKSTVTVSTMDVTDVKELKIADSEFEIPKDYKEVATGIPSFSSRGNEENKEPQPKKSTTEKVKGILNKIF